MNPKEQWRSIAGRGRGRDAATPSDEFPAGANEPPGTPAGGLSRRRFLSLVGASAALAGAAGCKYPAREEQAVPYTNRPVEIVPGVANYYATTWQEGSRVHPLLVKTREGRPIHIEGNDLLPRAPGKATARAQAQILELYDPERLRQPLVDGNAASWDDALGRVRSALRKAFTGRRPVLLLTDAVLSPSRRAILETLRRAMPMLHHVAWEPAADIAGAEAAAEAYGSEVRPALHLERARVILSLESDFLGSGDDPSAIAGFARSRRVEGRKDHMSRLWVLEGRMSLTGSNADERIALRPSRTAALAFALARDLHVRHHLPLPSGLDRSRLGDVSLESAAGKAGVDSARLEQLADDLAAARGEALVLAGPALPAEAHLACHLLNGILGSEGSTIDSAAGPRHSRLATPAEMKDLAKQAAAGRFEVALFWNANPCYAGPGAAAWKEALSSVPFRASLATFADETSAECQVTLATHHWLESWGDFESGPDLLTLQQPAVAPLHDTRQGEEVIDHLARGIRAAGGGGPYLEFLKRRWEQSVYTPGSDTSFETFWNSALHDGLYQRPGGSRQAPPLSGSAVAKAAAGTSSAGGEGMELVLHADPCTGDGRLGNNGWLQELPDPMTKVVWGNAALISVADAGRQGVEDGDLVTLSPGGSDLAVTLPALIQPGQAEGVLSVALGYGRRAGSVAQGVGVDAWPLVGDGRGSPYLRSGVEITRTGGKGDLVRTQEHGTLHGRDHARSLGLEDYAHHGLGHGSHHPEGDLYAPLEFPGHHWGMVIDLNACVGCSGCMIACQSENNIPVVGPEQVEKGREMHWIRLDRYYEGSPEDPDGVVHQPMLCQHCDKAPCENVCPVNATTHSPEGLNQMAYNRCVGTRYCANNCPYKVRRFNFFDYHAPLEEPAGLAFNPEVSVRPRGVMEKCTFCVQRIEDVKARARSEGREPADGEIRPACAAACPADAIVFGDRNDEASRIAGLWHSDRGYRVLQAELGIDPSIVYLARLRNGTGDGSGEGGSHES